MQTNLLGHAVEDSHGRAIRRFTYARAEISVGDGRAWVAVEQEAAEYEFRRLRARDLASGEERWFSFEDWFRLSPLVRFNEQHYPGPISKAFVHRMEADAFRSAIQRWAGDEVAADFDRVCDLQRRGNAMLW